MVNFTTFVKSKRKRKKEITFQDIQENFDLPIKEAADAMQISLTQLKRICRENDIPRWPYRKLQALQNKLQDLQDSLTQADELTRQRTQSKIDSIHEEIKFIRAYPKTIIESGSGGKRNSITKSKRWSLPSMISGDSMSSCGSGASTSNILDQTFGGANSAANRRSQNEEEFFKDLQQRLSKQYGGMPAGMLGHEEEEDIDEDEIIGDADEDEDAENNKKKPQKPDNRNKRFSMPSLHHNTSNNSSSSNILSNLTPKSNNSSSSGAFHAINSVNNSTTNNQAHWNSTQPQSNLHHQLHHHSYQQPPNIALNPTTTNTTTYPSSNQPPLYYHQQQPSHQNTTQIGSPPTQSHNMHHHHQVIHHPNHQQQVVTNPVQPVMHHPYHQSNSVVHPTSVIDPNNGGTYHHHQQHYNFGSPNNGLHVGQPIQSVSPPQHHTNYYHTGQPPYQAHTAYQSPSTSVPSHQVINPQVQSNHQHFVPPHNQQLVTTSSAPTDSQNQTGSNGTTSSSLHHQPLNNPSSVSTAGTSTGGTSSNGKSGLPPRSNDFFSGFSHTPFSQTNRPRSLNISTPSADSYGFTKYLHQNGNYLPSLAQVLKENENDRMQDSPITLNEPSPFPSQSRPTLPPVNRSFDPHQEYDSSQRSDASKISQALSILKKKNTTSSSTSALPQSSSAGNLEQIPPFNSSYSFNNLPYQYGSGNNTRENLHYLRKGVHSTEFEYPPLQYYQQYPDQFMGSQPLTSNTQFNQQAMDPNSPKLDDKTKQSTSAPTTLNGKESTSKLSFLENLFRKKIPFIRKKK